MSSRTQVTLGVLIACVCAGACPDQVALDAFKHHIVYEATWPSPTLKGQALIHIGVYQRGSVATFYVKEPLKDFPANLRMIYDFANGRWSGGGTLCDTSQDWRECLERHRDPSDPPAVTCESIIDLHAIPAWKPSPNDENKRRIAGELLKEIEHNWADWPIHEIVIRDFNVKDEEITIYMRRADGPLYQTCAFNAMSRPHCQGWGGFGMSPLSGIRQYIFARPYRLK